MDDKVRQIGRLENMTEKMTKCYFHKVDSDKID